MKEEELIARVPILIIVQYIKAFVYFFLSSFPMTIAFGFSITPGFYFIFGLPFALLGFYLQYLSVLKLILAHKAEKIAKQNIKKEIISKKIQAATKKSKVSQQSK